MERGQLSSNLSVNVLNSSVNLLNSFVYLLKSQRKIPTEFCLENYKLYEYEVKYDLKFI